MQSLNETFKKFQDGRKVVLELKYPGVLLYGEIDSFVGKFPLWN